MCTSKCLHPTYSPHHYFRIEIGLKTCEHCKSNCRIVFFFVCIPTNRSTSIKYLSTRNVVLAPDWMKYVGSKMRSRNAANSFQSDSHQQNSFHMIYKLRLLSGLRFPAAVYLIYISNCARVSQLQKYSLVKAFLVFAIATYLFFFMLVREALFLTF